MQNGPPTTSLPVSPQPLSWPARLGAVWLLVLVVVCFGSLPWTLGRGTTGQARYNEGRLIEARLPPWWAPASRSQALRLNALVPEEVIAGLAEAHGVPRGQVVDQTAGPVAEALAAHWDRTWLGTDAQGRSMLVRLTSGGAISIAVGLAAAVLSVVIGTVYGMLAGYAGGWTDAVLMRAVDVLYGLPYVLLVVLIAVAGDAVVSEYVSRQRERSAWVSAQSAGQSPEALQAAGRDRFPPRQVSETARRGLDVLTLLVAIGGVSWLTMSRVIRGQVLSLRTRPFIEAARAMGASPPRVFFRHLLPSLAGPVLVYATLTVPQAVLQESFLSFLGIGVKAPLPSWGTIAAEGLGEINPYESNWWLLVFPCVALAVTLLALTFLGEGLRRRWVRA